MKKKGFTSIELLVVISIIGLLSSVVLASLNQARIKARDSQRKQDIIQVRNALELYYADHKSYPWTNYSSEQESWLASEPGTNFVFWDGSYPGEDIVGAYQGEQNYIPGLVPNYISKLPKDPKPGLSTTNDENCFGVNRSYVYASDGKDYKFISNCAMEQDIPYSEDPFLDKSKRCPGDICYAYGVWTDGAVDW